MSESAESIDYAEGWLRYSRYMEPAYRSALQALRLPEGSSGLDAGCGPGALFGLLAATIGPQGRITGIDVAESHLGAARKLIVAQGLQQQVSVMHADLTHCLSFADNSFDWIWCADVLWPHRIPNVAAVLDEFQRVVRPGGSIAIFFNSFYRGALVSGWPHLELPMIQAAGQHWFGDTEVVTETERAASWLRTASLEQVEQSIHVASHTAPLDRFVAAYLAEYLQFKYGDVTQADAHRQGLDDDDLETWRALVDPESARFILNDPDYYCFEVGILAVGKVPGE